MSSPRVALCMEYPLHQWGGVEVLVKELLAGLSPHFELLLASDDTPESLRESDAARFLTAHHPWNPREDFRRQAPELARWLKDQGARLVHFHLGGTYAMCCRSLTKSPIPLVAQSGIPCIATNHGAFALLDFCAPSRSLAARLALLPAFWLGRARTLAALRQEVTVSDNDLSNMRRWFPPFRGKFLRIYHSQLKGNEPFNDDRENTILCLGTVGPRKGQTVLAEAFARIAPRFPAWRLVIAGRTDAGGSEMARMRETIALHGLESRVTFSGAVSPEGARRLMLSCGIFAMPSFAEGLGLSLQEALFAGCPAVASRVGGIQDMIIHEETGLLAEVGSADSLAEALARAIESPGDRRKWGFAAIKRISDLRMTCAEMIDSHTQLYKNFLNQLF